jgi:Pentapeptide repeats (9 copies)
MERTDKRPGRLMRPPFWPRPRDGAKLIPIGLAIGGMLFLALSVAAGVIAVLFAIGQFRGFRKEPLTAASLYDLLKIGFAFAAGIGGVVALVTAYRRQRVAEFAQELADRAQELADRAEDREAARLFNERFGEAAGQLGHDNAAVRLAGVYAMARLADDWPAQRQTCVDVLCAYLRMPYQPDPDPDAPAADRQAFRSLREVRRTVISVITIHLQSSDRRIPTAQDWRGRNLDFTGTVFDVGNFQNAQFTGGTVRFDGAQFTGGEVRFVGAEFTGGTVSFRRARFTGGKVIFDGARFAGGTVRFDGAEFTGGEVSFGHAEFAGGTVRFDGAEFAGPGVSDLAVGDRVAGGKVIFDGAQFTGGKVIFDGAQFTGGEVSFDLAMEWSAPPLGIDWDNPPLGVVAPGTGAGGTGASTSGP